MGRALCCLQIANHMLFATITFNNCLVLKIDTSFQPEVSKMINQYFTEDLKQFKKKAQPPFPIINQQQPKSNQVFIFRPST